MKGTYKNELYQLPFLFAECKDRDMEEWEMLQSYLTIISFQIRSEEKWKKKSKSFSINSLQWCVA